MAEGAAWIAGYLVRVASMTATMNGAQAARRSRAWWLLCMVDAIGERAPATDGLVLSLSWTRTLEPEGRQ